MRCNDPVQARLAHGSLNILNEVIGFLSDSENVKMIQHHRFNDGALKSTLKPKNCQFGLDRNLSKTRLKKLLKEKHKNSECCGNMDVCVKYAHSRLSSKGTRLSPKLERAIAFKGAKSGYNLRNPYQDADFSSDKVLKKLKFEKGAESNNHAMDKEYDDCEDYIDSD